MEALEGPNATGWVVVCSVSWQCIFSCSSNYVLKLEVKKDPLVALVVHNESQSQLWDCVRRVCAVVVC